MENVGLPTFSSEMTTKNQKPAGLNNWYVQSRFRPTPTPRNGYGSSSGDVEPGENGFSGLSDSLKQKTSTYIKLTRHCTKQWHSREIFENKIQISLLWGNFLIAQTLCLTRGATAGNQFATSNLLGINGFYGRKKIL